MRDFDGCTTFSFPFPFVFPARIWKTRFSTRFSNPMESSRPTLRYSGELLLSVCPFFRLLARVHSIPFRLVCAGRGRRGSVCGVDRSISRMKDRVNENKWYFQRLFDSDFFFFFFLRFGRFERIFLDENKNYIFPFLPKLKRDARKVKNMMFFLKKQIVSWIFRSQLKLILVFLLFFSVHQILRAATLKHV